IGKKAADSILSGKDEISLKLFASKMARQNVKIHMSGGGQCQEWSFDVLEDYVLKDLGYKIVVKNNKKYLVKMS
ncbi:MAG: hypothetical protein DSY85_17715, partial [Marinomonas sp.]